MTNLKKQTNSIGPKRAVGYIKENPHLAVSVGLFCGGGVALALNVASLAGSLFGAGGALLGAWITEINKRRTDAAEKAKRQLEAADALAPELQRTIERVLYIHERAIANFICESAQNEITTNDQQDDFRPYSPVLYPNAPQIRDLPGEKTVVLVRFYDSLHTLNKFADEWWERKGQLAVNIFLSILHNSEQSLELALVCIGEFEIERRFPPRYESWGTLTSRIERSKAFAADAMKHHMARAEARSADKSSQQQKAPFRTY